MSTSSTRTDRWASRPRRSGARTASVKDGEEWKSTQNFGRNDLLVLAKVADQAHSRIFELPQEEEPETES